VRVRECDPPGLLSRYPYIDLVGLDEVVARGTLLTGVVAGRKKPAMRPPFPSGPPPHVLPLFPGAAARLPSVGLPGRGRCIGRDDLLRGLVATVLSKPPPPIPVLGAPGVGKSTVTIAMLHHPRVTCRFGSRRYFIRCEGAATATALLTSVATSFGMELSPELKPRVIAARRRRSSFLTTRMRMGDGR
jgi:hypothetical protein